jgi:hypothetical protein
LILWGSLRYDRDRAEAGLAGQMEIVARWKKQSQAVPTILKFVDVLQQEVKLALGVSE